MGLADAIARTRLPQLAGASLVAGIAVGVGAEALLLGDGRRAGSAADAVPIAGILTGTAGLCGIGGIGLPGPVVSRWRVDAAEAIAQRWVDLDWSGKLRRGGSIALGLGAGLLAASVAAALIDQPPAPTG